MAYVSFFRWFKNVSIAKKLYSVVGIMAILITVELGTLYFAVNTLSSVRAFVGGEGLWSKSQKDAIYHLQQYSQTHDKEDEQAFEYFMKVPLGDHKTLFELKKKDPDLEIARQGLLEGRNHPDDIDGMIKLFRRFKGNPYIDKSINLWSEADSTAAQLLPIAKKLHNEINPPAGQADSHIPSQRKLNQIIRETEPINQKLTKLEDDFSYTLGEGARWLENIILKLLFAIALTVEFSGLLLTYFVIRGISKGLKEITNASKSIANRDFGARARVFSNDEIGVLANSFNYMATELSNIIQKQIRSSQDLESKTKFIQENEVRILAIMDALIKTTRLDFSEKLSISDRGDELDAIAVGLNTMSEELEFHLKQLQHSEELLIDAQRLAKIGNWELDFATKEVRWSEEMFHIYGYGTKRFKVSLDKSLERMLPEDAERTKERMKKHREDAIQSFLENGALEFRTPPSTFTLVLPDDSRKVVQGISKIILNKNGQVIKMAGTVQDIDERYKVEKKLYHYTSELETKNRELAQFAYAASHDLQEPLRTISNFSKLLSQKLEKNPDKEITKYMSLVSGGADRMSNLIFDLLEYSRTGKDMVMKITDCNQIMDEVRTNLAVMIEESSAEIHIKKLPVLKCYNLKSVFQNLIINAIKFKRKGISPIIHISASDMGKEILFKVKDNGIGIEKEYYERIFIIFQRLHIRTEYEGTGIGLSLTKKIVELNGGKIWVESEFGTGSTFNFTIPKI